MVFTLVAFLLAIVALQAVSSQQQPACPDVLQAAMASSCTFNNCTSLTCPLAVGGGGGAPGSLTFSVMPCVDPVNVVVAVGTPRGDFVYQEFNRSGNINLIGGSILMVSISRNSTHLDFAIDSSPTPESFVIVPVVPRHLIPLNPDLCMCDSVRTLAGNTGHSFLSPTCNANPACDGVDCVLLVFGAAYHIELLILPCIDSVELVVRDANMEAIFATTFNETGVRPLVIGSTTLMVDTVIASSLYSMNVSAIVEDFLFGPVEIFPLHTIILDRTHCNLTNFTTLAPPPSPTPLPTPQEVDSSPTCQGFYDAIRGLYREPFICNFLRGNCSAGISCSLDLLNLRYAIDVELVSPQRNFVVEVFDDSGRRLEVGFADTVTADLPLPDNAMVVVTQRAIAGGVRGFQIDLNLVTRGGRLIQDNLLPFSRIASAFEQCQTLIQATFDAGTRCYANGGCTGLNCDLDVTSVEENDMVFVVDKCRDPVLVNITIYHGGEAVRSVSQDDWIFLGGGEYLAVTMERNATDLYFSAYITTAFQSTEQVRPVVPATLVPLNASQCMCQSVAELADLAAHTEVETDCSPTPDCNGITCNLNVLGRIFRLETSISPCDELAYISVFDDGETTPFFVTQLEGTGTSVLEVIEGFPLNLDVVLERMDFSMLIAATIDEPLFGTVEIIPRHLLILDRTVCNHRDFVTISRPLPATLPPAPQPSASDTCMALYGLISRHFAEPFSCTLQESCDDGVQCQLEILDTVYDVALSLSEDSRSFSMEVRDAEGNLLQVTAMSGSSDSGDVFMINITLPRPMNSNLSLEQNFNSEKKTITMSLSLYVFALDGTPRKDVLISQTLIPVNPSSVSKSTIAVATAVPILLLVTIAAVTALIILLVIFMRKKNKTQPFEFEQMRHSELEEKDLENYLTTQEGSFPGAKAGVISSVDKNGSSAGGGGEGGREEKGEEHSEKKRLQDIDLSDNDSMKGHLV